MRASPWQIVSFAVTQSRPPLSSSRILRTSSLRAADGPRLRAGEEDLGLPSANIMPRLVESQTLPSAPVEQLSTFVRLG